MSSRLTDRSSGRRSAERKGRALLAAAVLLASAMTVIGLADRAVHAGDAPAAKEMKNPFEGRPEAIREGEKIFDAKCAECHGGDATGGAGPDLTDDKWIYGGSDAEVFATVSGGRKGGMPSWKSELGKDDIWKVISYIRSLHKK